MRVVYIPLITVTDCHLHHPIFPIHQRQTRTMNIMTAGRKGGGRKKAENRETHTGFFGGCKHTSRLHNVLRSCWSPLDGWGVFPAVKSKKLTKWIGQPRCKTTVGGLAYGSFSYYLLYNMYTLYTVCVCVCVRACVHFVDIKSTFDVTMPFMRVQVYCY